jgi:hypothetical protein
MKPVLSKSIRVGGKDYLEQDLLMMIEHYYKTTSQNPILPSLVPDILKEILYYTDLNTLKRFCQANKEYQLLCQDYQFWKTKFLKQQLPLLYAIHPENEKLTKNKSLKKEPKTREQWEKLYKDTLINLNIAGKFVTNIIKTNKFNTFTHGEIAFQDCLWFPVDWFKIVKELISNKITKRYHFRPEVIYRIDTIKNIYTIQFHIDFDVEEGDDFEPYDYFNYKDDKYTLILSQQDFIIYIAKLLYTFEKFDKEDVFLFEYFEDDEDGIIIYRQDLKMKPTKNIKTIFPHW